MSTEEKEITVKAPSKPVTSPEEKTRKTTEKALEEERFSVLQFPKKISKYLGITVTATGGMLIILFAYMGITGQTGGLLLSSDIASSSLFIWGLVGVVNIIVGFLFFGRE